MIYSLKVAALTAVLYLLWRITLRKETLHRLNRTILLLTPVLSMILPLCVITIHRTVTSAAPEAEVAVGTFEEVARSSLTAGSFVGIIYLVGVVLVLLKMAWSSWKLWNVIGEGEAHRLQDGSTLIVTEENLPPFSWMGHIVMSREDYAAGNQEIILHEQAHIRLFHSLDILLTEILTAFQWYNPLIWMLGTDLRGVHEYEADERVLDGCANRSEYQLFLIKRAALASGLSLVSGLHSGTIRERIAMMLKSRTDRKAGLKALYIIPVIVLTLIACSKTVTETVPPEDEPYKLAYKELVSSHKIYEVEEEDRVPFQLVENKPTFNGGNANEFSRWVNAHLTYPKEAKDNLIHGRVTLKFTVTKTGKVKDVKVLRGVNPLLDNEAVRVISASPDWTPGQQKGRPVDVTYTFPVIFELR